MERKEFDVCMRADDVFAFNIKQQLSGFKGLFNLAINVIVILCLVLNWENYETTAILLLFLILFLFDVYTPVTLYLRSKNQASDKVTIHYVVTEAGVTISRAGESLELLWGHFQKFQTSRKRIYVYTSRVTAFVLPKEQVGNEAWDFLIEQLKKNKAEFGTKSLNTAKCTVDEEPSEENAESAEK